MASISGVQYVPELCAYYEKTTHHFVYINTSNIPFKYDNRVDTNQINATISIRIHLRLLNEIRKL